VTACAEFRRWLDEGMPAPDRAHRAHAAACADCAREWEAALALERLLDGATIAAPAGFADRVMSVVAVAPAEAPTGQRAIAGLGPELPWWVRAAADPACAGALLVAALLAGWNRQLVALGLALTHRWMMEASGWARPEVALPRFISPAAASVFQRPEVVLVLALAFGSALAWAAWRVVLDRR
jgi:hypothetical protein